LAGEFHPTNRSQKRKNPPRIAPGGFGSMPRLAGCFTNPSHPPRAQKYPRRLPYCYGAARGISVEVRVNIPWPRHSRAQYGMQEEYWLTKKFCLAR